MFFTNNGRSKDLCFMKRGGAEDLCFSQRAGVGDLCFVGLFMTIMFPTVTGVSSKTGKKQALMKACVFTIPCRFESLLVIFSKGRSPKTCVFHKGWTPRICVL